MKATSPSRRLPDIMELKAENLDRLMFLGRKPILHPLSDLIKPCLPEGKMPAKEMKDDLMMSWCVAYDEAYDIITENKETLTAKVKMLPHEMVEWLFEHHFDVNNLIGQDLATDVNTIEK
jgi:hypothetical protein